MRRIYSRPRQRGTTADPGKVSTCVQVGMRPETTRTLETRPDPLTQRAARGACLARIGRIDVFHQDAARARFVLDEGLQLPKRPAVQSGADTLAGRYAIADVGQVLHYDSGSADPLGLQHDSLARFVVDVRNASPFLAGDLPELLPRTLAAVGLKTTTQGKVVVAPMAQSLPAPDLARAGCGKSGFPHIKALHRTAGDRFRVGGFDDEVE